MKSRLFTIFCIMLSLVFVFAFTACKESSVKEDSTGEKEETKVDSVQKEENKSEEKIDVNLLIHEADDSMRNIMAYIEPMFETEFPNLNINLEMSPGTAEVYETKIRTLVSAGDTPDVWWSHGGSWAQPVINAKAALPLEDYLDQMNYWDIVIPTAKVPADDGHIYAIPFENIFYEVILYNTEIFEQNDLKPPTTYAELEEIVKVLKDKGITPFAVAGKDGWPVDMFVEGFAYTVDPLITPKICKGEAKFSDKPYELAAQKVKELIDMGAFTENVALTDYGEAVEEFQTGKAAMNPNGSWALGSTYKNMDGKSDFFYYPVLDAAKADQYAKSVAGGVKKNAGIFVSADGGHPEEFIELAIFIGKMRGKYEYQENGNPSIAYEIKKLGWEAESEIPAPILKLMSDIPAYENVYGLLQDALPTAIATTGVNQASSKFMTGQVSVEDYLKEMDQAMEN